MEWSQNAYAEHMFSEKSHCLFSAVRTGPFALACIFYTVTMGSRIFGFIAHIANLIPKLYTRAVLSLSLSLSDVVLCVYSL